MNFDKTFCASPQCVNDCGRKMTEKEKDYFKELAYVGLRPSNLIWQGYFCGEPEEIEE